MIDPAKRRRMAITAGVCTAIFAGMVGLAFAAPPLYRAFCRATGYGGETQIATSAPSRVLARPIEVRFDTNVPRGIPLEFDQVAPEHLRLGETGIATFRVRNLSDKPVVWIARFNVAPHKTGQYFQKIQCFCLQQQTLGPGETRDMPVVYYVDPKLAANPDTEEVQQITLSYTFYESVEAAAEAAEREAKS